MAIILYVPTLAFGATKISQQNLLFVWMILVLNTLIPLILTIFSMPYRNSTKYISIGKVENTVDLL